MGWEQILFIVIGAFSILSGVTKFGFNSRKAQRMIRLIGEVPTRVFYIILGIGLIVVAFLVDFSA